MRSARDKHQQASAWDAVGVSSKGREIGPLWAAMHRRPRRDLATLVRGDVPTASGVYALYRDGQAVYIGKASSLKTRFWGNHMSTHPDLTKSALRRNVAEHLAIAPAGEIKARRYHPTEIELGRIAAWIRRCSVAWIECESAAAAADLETAMKAEWMPPLTKR